MARICELNELVPSAPVALTIGVFDGVHRGHQALIGRTRERGRDLAGQSVVLMIYPHPSTVLSPESPVPVLSNRDERAQLIARLGVDVVARLEFTRDLSRLPAEDFLDLLQRHVLLRELWVGPDFALGYRRMGTVERLRQLGQERGFSVNTVPPLHFGGERVSSSRIRDLVAAGDVEQATLLLGRHTRIEGAIVSGLQRGRTLGFPTANLAFSAPYLLPANGIYAVYAELDGTLLPAVANIGVRPTFGDNDRLVEVYILDFNGMIYGQRLGVHIVKRLREELRFATVAALVEQMERDVADARAVL
jgi:riboflavin kinase/FMN adenylyltransferase